MTTTITISLHQIEAAAQAWLSAMRKAWLMSNINNSEECPIRSWEDYSEADRGVMLAAAKQGLLAAARAD